MKLIHLFILCLILISDILCLDFIGKDNEIELYPKNSSWYVYLNLYEYSSNEKVYLTLKYKSSGKLDSSIKIQYINDINSNINRYNWELKNSYGSYTSVGGNGYYFEIGYKDYKYTIVQYSGFQICNDCY